MLISMQEFFFIPHKGADSTGLHTMGRGQVCAGETSQGEKNFFLLRESYRKWDEGLFGSRNYYKRKIQNLLNEMVGKEIVTEYDYTVVSSDGGNDKIVVCNLQWGRWLHVHGELDEESIKKIAGPDVNILRSWWRSGILVAVAGTLKKFRLEREAGGRTVHIYLDKVRLIQ
jgi:hypothetical protein